MSEILGWTILAALAVTVAGMFMLFVQIERQSRRTLEAVMLGSELIAAQLLRNESVREDRDQSLTGLIIERTGIEHSPPRAGNAGSDDRFTAGMPAGARPTDLPC